MSNIGMALLGGFAQGVSDQITANKKAEDNWDKEATKAYEENYAYYRGLKAEYNKKKEKEDALTALVGGDPDNSSARNLVRTSLAAGISDPTVIQRMYEQVKNIPKTTKRQPQTEDDAGTVPMPPKPSQIPATQQGGNLPPLPAAALSPSAPPQQPTPPMPQEVLDKSNMTDGQPDAAFSPAKVEDAISDDIQSPEPQAGRGSGVSDFFRRVFGVRSKEERENALVQKLSQVYGKDEDEIRRIRAGELPERGSYELPSGVDIKQVEADIDNEKMDRAIRKSNATRRPTSVDEKLSAIDSLYEKFAVAKRTNPEIKSFPDFIDGLMSNPEQLSALGLRASDLVRAGVSIKKGKGSGSDLGGYSDRGSSNEAVPSFATEDDLDAAIKADPSLIGKPVIVGGVRGTAH